MTVDLFVCFLSKLILWCISHSTETVDLECLLLVLEGGGSGGSFLFIQESLQCLQSALQPFWSL